LAILVATGRKDLIFWKDISLGTLKLIFIITGIVLNAPLDYFVYLGFINCAVLLILFLYMRHKEHGGYLVSKPRIAESLFFIRQGAVFTVLMAANVIYNKIDIIMLEKMKGSIEVGYYSGATRFIYPFMFISTAFMTALFPSLAKYSNDKLKFSSIQNLALYTLGFIGIILSTLLFFGSTFIFNSIFQDKYDASIPVFRILVWYLAIVFIYGSISNNLVAKGKVTFLVYLNIVMIVVNVILNFLLIPKMGAKGAAISTLICEVIILFSGMIYWNRVK
ncbi:MAG TPA: polysaccharide biosynthesis C-terminal domain-containing protein, partial [Sphingobacteriaceae bacterium]